jgi:hypothetical protein
MHLDASVNVDEFIPYGTKTPAKYSSLDVEVLTIRVLKNIKCLIMKAKRI